MADLGPDRGSTTGIPRWVKMIGINALILILLVVAVILIGGGLGGHRPPGGGH